MNELLAGFKKEFDEKYPNGATYEDINEFCKEHPILCHKQAQTDFTTYISRAGE